ncbi:hypothetical protein AC480_05705 [miscellaneous Crenarchaeota group archaeon SMTZ1-55]|nr:MAG: hypothetical protein AC480_05705 [miscellaneous Crenarchaeota group archaeon SMTZ1-55]
MHTHDGFTIEDLFLKTRSSPSPSEDQFENVPCVLIQPSTPPRRAAVLYLHGGEEVTLDDPPWVRGVVGDGMIVLGASLPRGEPLASAVAKTLKGVSYLDLRRDIVDRGEIVVWSQGDLGVVGLIAAVLDERVKGVVVEVLPPEVFVDGGVAVEVAAICSLLPPKTLLVVGHRRRGLRVQQVIDAYRRVGQGARVRLEERLSREGVTPLMRWMLGEVEE